MRLILTVAAAACVLPLLACAHLLEGQCLENNYVLDGAPASQLDCQPTAAIKLVDAGEMPAEEQQLVNAHHDEILGAARFYGYDLDALGWGFQLAESPLVRKHLLLVFTNATPAKKASRVTVVVPYAEDEKVQAVPAFARGLQPYLPGWQNKSSYAVFNRLLQSEQGKQPLTQYASWMQYGVLYLALAGGTPLVPTDTDSVKANWDLTLKRATTPVIVVYQDGSAMLAFSDLSDAGKKTASWKLSFNKVGEIVKADREEHTGKKSKFMPLQQELPYEANGSSPGR